MHYLLSGIFLGWSLGANDAANLFGSAVTSKMLKFRTAAIMGAIFVLLGAIWQGQAGIETIKGLTQLNLKLATISSIAAALTVTVMTFCRLPISTSQAVVGAIVGIGLIKGQLYLGGLGKVVVCWFGTPIGGLLVSITLYRVLGVIYNRLGLNLFQGDIFLRLGLIISGCYCAYALGANNVANVTAVFVGAGLLSILAASIIGGLSIGLGIITYSKGVMETVGSRLVKLDAFSALVVVLSGAITVHFFTIVGVPVSASQAVIGAALGVGIVKSISTIRRQTLGAIAIGWFMTPIVAAFFSLILYSIFLP